MPMAPSPIAETRSPWPRMRSCTVNLLTQDWLAAAYCSRAWSLPCRIPRWAVRRQDERGAFPMIWVSIRRDGIGFCWRRGWGRLGGFSGRPGGQQAERIGGRRGGVCGGGGGDQTGGGDEFHRVVGQFHGAHDRVVELLDPAAVGADVMSAPSGAESLTAGGEFTDQFGEVLVVRGPPGLGTQQGHRHRQSSVVVGVVIRGAGIQKVEPGDVAAMRGLVEHW